MTNPELRARDEAIVLAAMPGTLASLARDIWPELGWREVCNATLRLKRAGLAQLNGITWEKVD